MKFEIQPKRFFLWTYVALSAAFILHDVAVDFRDGLLKKAYESGKTDTINALIANVDNGKCEAVNVYSGEKKVDLINVACLSGVGNQTSSTSPEPLPELPVSQTGTSD